MKVAITYPPIISEKGTPLISQNRQFQWFSRPTYIYPVVPAIAATMLKNAGYEVIWKDAISENISEIEYFDFLLHEKPDVIAMETKTPVIKYHWAFINKIKNRLPETKIVLMGDHVTALPYESFGQCDVDYILTGGDYDFLLLSLCTALQNGNINALEPGIFIKNERDEVISTGKFTLNHDLGTAPFIDRELTRWKDYSIENGNFLKKPGTYIMAARDCWWHRCTFCSWTTLYPSYRCRSAENVLDEIGLIIDKYPVREIMDDSGSFPIGDWLRSFCNGMIERGYNHRIRLNCNMRFGALSEDDYKLMRKAGFRFVLFGLESSSDETLQKIDKGVTKETIIDSCRMASRSGLSPHITIMFGYPWETEHDIKNTVTLGKHLMKKGYAKTLQATIVVPYPGTPLYEECRTGHLLKDLAWDNYDMKTIVMKTPYSENTVWQAARSTYKIAFDPQFIARNLLSIRSLDDIEFIAWGAKKVLGHILDFKK